MILNVINEEDGKSYPVDSDVFVRTAIKSKVSTPEFLVSLAVFVKNADSKESDFTKKRWRQEVLNSYARLRKNKKS